MPRTLRFKGEVPDELFDERFREEDFLQGLKEEAVVKLFQAGRITSGSEAQLLGIARRDFLELLYRRGVPYFWRRSSSLGRRSRSGGKQRAHEGRCRLHVLLPSRQFLGDDRRQTGERKRISCGLRLPLSSPRTSPRITHDVQRRSQRERSRFGRRDPPPQWVRVTVTVEEMEQVEVGEVTPEELEERRVLVAQMKEFGQSLAGRQVNLGNLMLEGREELENRA